MAQFFRGQRVRKVANRHPDDFSGRHAAWSTQYPLGTEGAVTDPTGPFDEVGVLWDGGERVWCVRYMIAPLTDPSAERFIESIKNLGREPINDAPKVTVDK